MVVVGLGGLDVDAQRHGREAVGLAAERRGPLRIGQHLRRLQMPVRLVNHDLDGGVFQFHQLQQGGIQGQIGKAAASMRQQTRVNSFSDSRHPRGCDSCTRQPRWLAVQLANPTDSVNTRRRSQTPDRSRTSPASLPPIGPSWQHQARCIVAEAGVKWAIEMFYHPPKRRHHPSARKAREHGSAPPTDRISATAHSAPGRSRGDFGRRRQSRGCSPGLFTVLPAAGSARLAGTQCGAVRPWWGYWASASLDRRPGAGEILFP